MRIVTPPVATPVTLEEVRAQLRLDGTEEDALLAGYLDAAVEHVQTMTSQLLMPQTVAFEFDSFEDMARPLPCAPIRAIQSISYEAADGSTQTVEPSEYRLRERGRLALIARRSGCWPQLAPGAVVTVTAEAGYEDAEAVPVTLRQAILFLAAHFYETRTPVGAASSSAELPLTFRHLVEPHRLWLI